MCQIHFFMDSNHQGLFHDEMCVRDSSKRVGISVFFLSIIIRFQYMDYRGIYHTRKMYTKFRKIFEYL